MSEEATVVSVVGSFDIMQVQDACTRLQEALTSCGEVVLDLSAVDGIDLAGLQLVCAAHRTALEQGVRFSLVRPLTPVVEERALTAGFATPIPCQGGDGTPCIWGDVGAGPVGGGAHE
jgi:anti-anti-sigma regulatory factor